MTDHTVHKNQVRRRQGPIAFKAIPKPFGLEDATQTGIGPPENLASQTGERLLGDLKNPRVMLTWALWAGKPAKNWRAKYVVCCQIPSSDFTSAIFSMAKSRSFLV